MQIKGLIYSVRIAAAISVTIAVSGCFFGLDPANCEVSEDISSIRAREPITVPEDLDSLDESKALKIPVATTPPAGPDQRCLEKPPRFEDAG